MKTFSFMPLLLVVALGCLVARAEDRALIPEEILKARDPFKRPPHEIARMVKKSDLETIPVESLKMVGVSTGPDRLRAIVQDPNGKTHFIAEKMKIGLRGGLVKRITVDEVVVRERITNILGQDETFETVIPLRSESNVPDRDKLKPGGAQ